jgi:hypothetical protein
MTAAGTAQGPTAAGTAQGPTAAGAAQGPTADRRTVLAVLVVVTAVVLAPVAAVVPARLLLAAAVALAMLAVAYMHPPFAAYVVLVVTPLTAGVVRGAVVPLLRPHEAVTLLVATGVLLRVLVELRAGRRPPLRFGAIDAAMIAMALASSVLPLLWMAARGLAPGPQDLFYASALWKFYGLFLLIRVAVRTETQVRRCLYLTMAAGSVMAVVTILQSLHAPGVPELVGVLFPGEAGTDVFEGRGSSTLGSSIAVGDVMVFDLAICLALVLWTRGSRKILLPLAALFLFGALASGQFSAVIALAICVFVIAVLTGQLRRLFIVLLPAGLIGAVVLRPVLQYRLENLDIATGLPQSWQIRYDNLRWFVWPELFPGPNWLFGVRPNARIRVDVSWGPYIYIESGHTWLLWTGGIPLVLTYLFFMVVAVRTTLRIARHRHDAVGVAAIAALVALFVVFVLMSFDPHLTMRGAADLMFTLLALTLVAPKPPPAAVAGAVGRVAGQDGVDMGGVGARPLAPGP